MTKRWHVDHRYRERFPGTCEAMDAVAARLLDGKAWDPDLHRLDKRVRGLMDRVAASGATERPVGDLPTPGRPVKTGRWLQLLRGMIDLDRPWGKP